ncbi:MAG: hypothetical protein Q8R30_01800 [bacterium]|nr:hypothetical protein [bacterium]MDZ4285297.1 hypothetical protein [Candidatus Sungbacteria bacterium]
MIKERLLPFLRKKSWLFYVVLLFVLFDSILFAGFVIISHTRSPMAYPELRDFNGSQSSFKDLAKYFTKLAEAKGAPYAFEVLKAASLPPDTDLHLLGHVVGDILYRQQGAEGIKVCTQDFRNACSHSIVVGLFTEKGEAALEEIAAICWQAPGQSGAYTMCFHGLGHGILSALGYDMPHAINVCEKTGKSESSQCISGAVMEIIGGGFHDREIWEKQRKKYLSDKNPMSLCLSDFMPEEARPMCFVYLTPHLFEAAGGNLAALGPQDFKKAFTFCDALPAGDSLDRKSCFGGFGKEFVVLAKNRDIRNIDSMTREELGKVYDWCLLTPDQKGAIDCINNATQSLYWGGENDRHVAIRFCDLMNKISHRSSCFQDLIGAVSFYIKDMDYRKEFCGELPPDFTKGCVMRLGV